MIDLYDKFHRRYRSFEKYDAHPYDRRRSRNFVAGPHRYHVKWFMGYQIWTMRFN